MRAFLTSESDAAAARADALAEELIRQEEAVQREAAERKGGRAANFLVVGRRQHATRSIMRGVRREV